MKRNNFLLIGFLLFLSCREKYVSLANKDTNTTFQVQSSDSTQVDKENEKKKYEFNSSKDTISYEYFKSLFNDSQINKNEIPTYLVKKFLNFEPDNDPNYPKIYPNKILFSLKNFDGLLYTFKCLAGGTCETTTLALFSKKGELISDFEYSHNYSDTEEEDILTSEISDSLVISSEWVKRKYDDKNRVVNEESSKSTHKILNDGKIVKVDGLD